MVMGMKRMKHSFRYRSVSNRNNLSLPFVLMAVGYMIGCWLGASASARFSLPPAVVSSLTEYPSADGVGFLSVFGSYGIYGLLFLLLTTTYLGFLLVPFVVALKGFVSGTIFLAFLQSEVPHAFLLAGISVCLPGIFVLPALFLLGRLYMQLSFRLLCRMRGDTSYGVEERQERVLAAVFVLLLAAALTESYAVPALLKLVPA